VAVFNNVAFTGRTEIPKPSSLAVRHAPPSSAAALIDHPATRRSRHSRATRRRELIAQLVIVSVALTVVSIFLGVLFATAG